MVTGLRMRVQLQGAWRDHESGLLEYEIGIFLNDSRINSTVIDASLGVTYYLPLTPYSLLFVTYYLLLITYYLLGHRCVARRGLV